VARSRTRSQFMKDSRSHRAAIAVRRSAIILATVLLGSLLYETIGGRQARGGACAESTEEGFLQNLSFDDPRSAFNGVRRSFDINSNRVSNAEEPEIWYSDPLGRNAQTQPFPGSIRQFIVRKGKRLRAPEPERAHGRIRAQLRRAGGARPELSWRLG